MNRLKTFAVLGLMVGAVVPALAVELDFSFAGSYTGSYIVTATPTADNSDYAVSGLNYTYTTDISGNVLNGTGSVTFVANPTVYIKFNGKQTVLPAPLTGQTMRGDVLSFYADAAFTQLLNPSGGSISYNLDQAGPGTISAGQFVGTFAPVPEPASVAVMALGVTGLLARRKRGGR